MSWYIRLAGKDKAALVARVRADHAPVEVEQELIRRIEAQKPAPDQVIVVVSHGHLDMPLKGPYSGSDTLVFHVHCVPYLDTPLLKLDESVETPAA